MLTKNYVHRESVCVRERERERVGKEECLNDFIDTIFEEVYEYFSQFICEIYFNCTSQ